MSEFTAALLIKALDGLNQRALLTAQNIANANTPDYRPVEVTFEDRLRQAANHGIDAVRDVAPQIVQTTPAPDAPPMRLDLELAAASQTAMRYRALIELLGQEMSLQRTAITGGQS